MMFRLVLVAAAALAALAPLPAGLVERIYSARVYAAIQPLLTSISNLTPLALLDAAIGVTVAWWIGLAVRDLIAPRRLRGLGRITARTITWCAVVYVLFVALWGLNYRRPRMRDSLPFDASAVTPGAARAAAVLTVARLNALHDSAHTSGWPAEGAVDPALAEGFARALRDVGIARDVVPARPKRTILDAYFRRAGVDGMTDPFFLETLIGSAVLPFERAFVVAHEWSHLAGIADEGEANFTGWLACMRGSEAQAYSGWLFLYSELARAVPPRDRAALSAALTPGPRADLRAIRDRYTRDVNPRVSGAGWRVYDSYLKANRVDAGTASYDEVVSLVLGVRVNGVPVLDR